MRKGDAFRLKSFRPLVWILLGAGLLYFANLPRTFIGCFSDDARDLLAAKALLQGHYASLQSPDHPPLNFPLPGFPLLLAPVMALVGHHWAWMKIIPLASALVSGILFWGLLEDVVEPRIRIFLLLLFLFNPSTLFLSGVLIADTVFVALVLAVFWYLKQSLRAPSSINNWALGILCACATMVRPEGILLPLTIVASFLYTKRSRQALIGLVPTAVVGIAWLYRNQDLTGQWSGYGTLWQMSLESLSRTTLLVHHWSRVANVWFWEMLLGISFGETSRWWLSLTSWAGGVFAIWGFFTWLRESNASHALALAMGLFAGSFMGLHGVWLAVHPHYFFPMLPFSLLFLAKALNEGERRWSVMAKIGALGLALAGATYAVQDYYQAFSSHGITTENRLPAATLAWIKTQVPLDPNHKILAVRAPTITLYTDRYSLAYVPARDAEQFRFQLLTKGISHVLIERVPILFVNVQGTLDPVGYWNQTTDWMANWPAAFRPVFSDEEEGTAIYEVKFSTPYVTAYQRFLDASRLFATGRVKEGMRGIELALQSDPELTSALNGYAAIVLEFGGPLDLAEARLREAIRLRPDFALARLNLARIHGNQQGAQITPRKAVE